MEERFTMYDLADKLGWKYIQRKNGYIKCPFCGTEKLACNITKTFFHCYKCGEGGNYYQIYAKLFGIEGSNGKSSTQVARQEIIKLLGGDTGRRIESVTQKEATSTPKRSMEDIHKAYCSLIRHTSLSENHKEALLKRGLSEEQIKAYGFRSVDNDRSESVCRLIQKDGLSLEGIPGFYYDIFNNAWRINTFGKDGYFCICPDENGYIQGFQIRLDNPIDGQKYLWLSSKNKDFGATPGSPSAYFGARKPKKLVVVDGILKANVCSCLSRDKETAFMGVAGVNNYKQMSKMLTEVAKRGVMKVYNAYDMDEFTNPACLCDTKHCETCKHRDDLIRGLCEYKIKKIEALKKGSKRLEETAVRLKLSYTRLTWDIGKDGYWQGNIKGLDDNLLKLKQRR